MSKFLMGTEIISQLIAFVNYETIQQQFVNLFNQAQKVNNV